MTRERRTVRAWPTPHRHFEVIKYVGRGDALHTITSDAALEFAKRGLPEVFTTFTTSLIKAITCASNLRR
jgi:hypothetical protein